MRLEDIVILAKAGYTADQINAFSQPQTMPVQTVQTVQPQTMPVQTVQTVQPQTQNHALTMQDVAAYMQTINRNNVSFDVPPSKTSDEALSGMLDQIVGYEPPKGGDLNNGK